MKKVKAFTLIELLVAMVIGSLVISFAYSGYLFIWKYYLDFKKTNTEMNDALFLNTVLGNDFKTSEKVYRADNDIKINTGEKEVLYSMNNNFILRKQGLVTDTFHIKVSGITSFFNEKEITTAELLVDKLVIEQDLLSRKEKFIFTKIYASDVLMKQDSLYRSHERY